MLISSSIWRQEYSLYILYTHWIFLFLKKICMIKSCGWQSWFSVWLMRSVTDVHNYVHPLHVLWVLNLCCLWVLILSLFLKTMWIVNKSADKLCSVICRIYPRQARSVKLLEMNWKQISFVGLLEQIWSVPTQGISVISGMEIPSRLAALQKDMC